MRVRPASTNSPVMTKVRAPLRRRTVSSARFVHIQPICRKAMASSIVEGCSIVRAALAPTMPKLAATPHRIKPSSNWISTIMMAYVRCAAPVGSTSAPAAS